MNINIVEINKIISKLEERSFKIGADFIFPDLYPAFNYYSDSFKFSKHYHEKLTI